LVYTFANLEGWTGAADVATGTYYYGVNVNNVTGAKLSRVYSDGTTTGPVVSAKVTVDDARDLAAGSTDPGRPPAKPGEKFLDTATGTIYTANSTGNGWLTTTEQMAADTAYAVKSIPTGTPENIYVLDSGAAATPPIAAVPPKPVAVKNVLDSASGNKNVFRYDAALGEWKSINENYGLSPDENSTTTQEAINAFGESMILSHDWEDKFTVYDSRGNPHTLIVSFRKVLDRPAEPLASPPTGAEAEWDWYAYYADSDGNILPQYGQGAGTMVFGDDGLLKRTYYYEPTPPVPDPNGTNSPSAPVYDTWTVVQKVIGNQQDDAKVTGKVVADFNLAGAEGSVNTNVNPATYGSNMITLDFLGSSQIEGVTNFGSESTTKLSDQDGYAMGVLNDWSVSGTGVITGSYSNGRNLPIAQVAVAMFANEQGLSKVGETCFAETVNSGLAQVGAPQTNGAGSIEGNAIEMSNVDLSEEFVNLIRAQRGFQANTRVVTTSDQVLEELINMKR
jgi:flagellar hook-basal body protein